MRAILCGLLLLACGAEINLKTAATGGMAGSPVDAGADVPVEAAGGAGGGTDASSTGGAAGAADAGPVACPEFEEGVATGHIASSAITEASGIVASRKSKDVLYVHNDSGDGPRIFAMSRTGAHLAELSLTGAGSQDWEDIAIGPGPTSGESYLYAGDIGDNKSTRANIKIYRVPEPTINPAGPPVTQALGNVETFTLTYADGAHNAEALLVDPNGGVLYLLTKNGTGASQLFRSPGALPSGGGSVTLAEAAKLTFGHGNLPGSPLVTGGDISPSGNLIAIRTYAGVFAWRRSTAQSIEQAFASEPCPIPSQIEGQGEAVGFARDGKGYYTVSEGKYQPVHFFALK